MWTQEEMYKASMLDTILPLSLIINLFTKISSAMDLELDFSAKSYFYKCKSFSLLYTFKWEKLHT